MLAQWKPPRAPKYLSGGAYGVYINWMNKHSLNCCHMAFLHWARFTDVPHGEYSSASQIELSTHHTLLMGSNLARMFNFPRTGRFWIRGQSLRMSQYLHRPCKLSENGTNFGAISLISFLLTSRMCQAPYGIRLRHLWVYQILMKVDGCFICVGWFFSTFVYPTCLMCCGHDTHSWIMYSGPKKPHVEMTRVMCGSLWRFL